MSRTRLVKVTVVLVGTIGLIVASRAAIQAFNPQPDPPGLFYGATMVQPGETLNVYVTNVDDPTSGRRHPPDPGFEVSFFDQFGRLQAQAVEQVPPQQTAAASFVGPRAGMTLLWVQVKLVRGDAPFISSMERVGSMGEMLGFVHPMALVGFNPQPDPPGQGR